MLKIFIKNSIGNFKKSFINFISFCPICLYMIPRMISEKANAYRVYNLTMIILIIYYLSLFTVKCPKCMFIIPTDKKMKNKYVNFGLAFNIIIIATVYLITSLIIKTFVYDIRVFVILIQTFTLSITSFSACLLFNRIGINTPYMKFNKLRNLIKEKNIYNEFFSITSIMSLVFSMLSGVGAYILQSSYYYDFSQVKIYSIVFNSLSILLLTYYMKKSYKTFLFANTDYQLVLFDRQNKPKDGGIQRVN